MSTELHYRDYKTLTDKMELSISLNNQWATAVSLEK